MYPIDLSDYERVRPLFRKQDLHLPLQAILAGDISAPIYVDNTLRPQTALTWTGHRFYLAGAPGNLEMVAQARKIFFGVYALQAWQSGIDSYVVNYPTEEWEPFITAMLAQKYPIKTQRSYFSLKANSIEWKSLLPAGFSIRQVNAQLLKEPWQNLEFLTDEMISERDSVEDFLAKSFGLCLVRADQIIGWCLSEYNTRHRCEVGIATHEDYQRRGFATLLASAFIELARSRDVARIGWHCSATNIGSGATALKTGFEKISDYPAFMGWFDDAKNLASNGYFAHGRGEYAQALEFYEKAFPLGDVPDWAYWGAACDAALLGRSEKALHYLAEAVKRGFDDYESIVGSKHLLSLHDTPGWQTILQSLKKEQN